MKKKKKTFQKFGWTIDIAQLHPKYHGSQHVVTCQTSLSRFQITCPITVKLWVCVCVCALKKYETFPEPRQVWQTRSPNVRLREQRTFNPSMFDMKAMGETLLQVHWPLICLLYFNYSSRCVSVCVCVCVSVRVFASGALGPVRLREMMSALRHMKQVQRRHSTACDHTRRQNQMRAHTHARVNTYVCMCHRETSVCVWKHRGVYQLDGVTQGTDVREWEDNRVTAGSF